MLKNYFRIAWRNIAKHKAYSFINVLGLSLGMCICLVIYLICHFELSFDRFHPDKERIYRVIMAKAGQDYKITEATVPTLFPRAARQAIPGLEEVAGYHLFPAKIDIPGNGKPSQQFDNKIEGLYVPTTIVTGPEYFAILKYDWVAGTPATSLNEPFRVVLSESSARKYFGDASFNNIVGQEVIYNDSLRVRVSGIVKDWKANTDFPFSEFISLSTINASFLKNKIRLDEWSNTDIPWNSRALVKLKKDIEPARVDAQLALLIKDRITTRDDEKITLSLQPLSDIHFNANIGDGMPKAHLPTLYVLMAIAIFILVLAVINFINLSTALSIQRAKEVGIRKVLGSNRSNLIFQFLIETGILTFFALLIALSLLKPVLYLFHSFIPGGVSFYLFNPPTLIFLGSITLLTSLLSGFYPARVLSSYIPVLCLKGAWVQKGSGKWLFRKGLIVFQFTISLIFIISTIVIGRQINYMRNEGLGFSTDAILTLDTDRADTTQKAKVLSERIQQLAGVAMVARQSFNPTTDLHTMISLQYKGKNNISLMPSLQTADQHFIPLYRMKLLAGSNLRNAGSLKEFVINESLSRAMGFNRPADALGKFLYLGDQAIPIIGVLSDFHEYSYHESIKPLVITDIPVSESSIAIRLATNGKKLSNLNSLLAQIGLLWKETYPNAPFNYHFLDDSIASLYEKEQKTATLTNTAMIITIFISCMGLFGLAMFTAKQRTKEIGIRKVLGAGFADIAYILSSNFVILIVIAILIASPIAWFCMHFWLQDFVYRIDISWAAFLIAGLAALVIGLLTVSFHTIKTAFINPADTLRTE